MTQEEFQSTFKTARQLDNYEWDHVFDVVRERLRGLDDAEQFELLFQISVMSQDDAPSCPAALLLRELSPRCFLSPEAAVRALLPCWDVSLEQVPFYLAARFGLTTVRQAISQCKQGITTEVEKKQLETVAYWLDKYEEAYIKAAV